MIAKFYKFAKKRNSTAQPNVTSIDYNITLKAPTSLESPTIIINGFDIANNYCQMLNTFYFVTDVVALNNELFEVSLEKDVLATYKGNIGSYTAFVNRSDSDYDINLNDDEMTSKQKIGATGFKATDISNLFDGVGCYILRVASDSSNSVSGIKTYIMTKAQVMGALSFMFSNDVFDSAWDSVVKATFNPFQYILSLRFCALSFSVMTQGCPQEPLKFGWWQSSNQSYYVANYVGARHTIGLSMPERFFNDFRDFNPNYSTYQLLLPASGLYDIPSIDMSLANLDAQLYVDTLTGKSTYYILLANSNSVLYRFDANICADIQISQNATDLTSILGNVISGVGSAMAQNPIGVAFSGANAIGSILQPSPSTRGSNGTIYELTSIRSIVIYTKYVDVVDEHPIGFGRPLNKNKLIGSLSGFVRCSGASIAIPGHADDTDRINSYLNSGFYYE